MKKGLFSKAKLKFINTRVYSWTISRKDFQTYVFDLTKEMNGGWTLDKRQYCDSVENQYIHQIRMWGAADGFIKARKLAFKKPDEWEFCFETFKDLEREIL